MPGDSRFKDGVAWNLASIVALGISGLGLNLLISVCYGAGSLGVFNQVLSLYVFFSQFAVAGIDRSVLKEIASPTVASPRAILSSAMGLTTLIALAITGLFLALRGVFSGPMLSSPGVWDGMTAIAPGLFFFALNKVLLAVVNGRSQMRAFAVLQTIRYVGLVAGFAVVYYGGMGPDRVAFVFTFSEAVLFLILAVLFWRECFPRRGDALVEHLRRHYRFGLRGILGGALLELNLRVDILVLGVFLTDRETGIYSFAAMVFEGIMQLAVVLQNNFNPVICRHLALRQYDELREVFSRSRAGILRVAWGLAALCCLAYPIATKIVVGPEFDSSWLPFVVLILGLTVSSVFIPFFQVFNMAGRPGWQTLFYAIVVSINVGLALLLVPRFELVGAAVATATSMYLSTRVIRWLTVRALGFSLS
jgi:O-antigen/teichoic acid export membrane protein